MTRVVGAGDERAVSPSPGPPPRWYPRVVERAVDVALAAVPVPLTMLNVGCGTGELLQEMVARVPYGESFVGTDADPERLGIARRTGDPRVSFVLAHPESLPFEDASFDLVVAAAGIARWADPAAGVAELGRVLRDRGRFVLVERAAAWLPQGGRPRSPRRLRALLEQAGLQYDGRETLRRLGFMLPTVRAFLAFP